MMRIDLLPPEKKRLERTPLHRFIVILIGVAIIASLAFLNLYFFLVTIPANRIKLEDLQDTQKSLKRTEEEYKRLSQDLERLQTYIRDVEILTKRKFYWTDVIAQIRIVLQQHPNIKIENIKVYSGREIRRISRKIWRRKKITAPFALELKGTAKGINPRTVADFRASLRKNRIISEIFPMMNPDPQITYKEDKKTKEVQTKFLVILIGAKEKL
jgi:hypothetical protein